MRGYVDLHCHWLTGVDDGAHTMGDGIALLRGLREIGFDRVFATPHMAATVFDTTREELVEAFAEQRKIVEKTPDMPAVGLSCEHHLDDVVFRRLMADEALPYPGGHAALIEFPTDRFPVNVTQRIFELRCRRIRPVLAHPERYRPVWKDIEALDPVLDGGAVALLDVAALASNYGRPTQRCAEELLEEGYYHAACSDAHRPRDVEAVARGIERLYDIAGDEEAQFLLTEGPQEILAGKVMD